MMTREAYERLGGGCYHFETSDADVWQGVVQGANRGSLGWGENLFHTRDGRWIIGIHRDGQYFVRQTGRSAFAFREVALDFVARWCAANRVELPTALVEEMNRAFEERTEPLGAAGAGSKVDSATELTETPAVRAVYYDLDSGRSVFDPNHPDFYWEGVWIVRDGQRIRIDLFFWRTRWIMGNWTEEGYCPSPAMPPDGRSSFVEVTPNDAMQWFEQNRRPPPDLVLEEAERWKRHGPMIRATTEPPVNPFPDYVQFVPSNALCPPDQSDPPPRLTAQLTLLEPAPPARTDDAAPRKSVEDPKPKAGVFSRIASRFGRRRAGSAPVSKARRDEVAGAPRSGHETRQPKAEAAEGSNDKQTAPTNRSTGSPAVPDTANGSPVDPSNPNQSAVAAKLAATEHDRADLGSLSRSDPLPHLGKTEPPPSSPSRKRSTERGEGRTKIISALTEHHKYARSSCLNSDPIGNNELAKAAGVSRSTASEFFKSEFKGHTKYRALCRDASRLADALKVLNGEFSPLDLYGRRPPNEDDRDED
jgi:hypothetical protein